MAVKHKVKFNATSKIRENAKALNGRKIEVGVFEGEHQWLAGIHEYGCDIIITPKMRKWLHTNGLHVKDTTTIIHIPERSFLRTGHDENIDEVLKRAGMALALVLDGKMSEDKYLDMIGQMLSSKIKKYARDLSDPPNHPFTVERKGSSNPLVGGGEFDKGSGGMIEGITWRVE